MKNNAPSPEGSEALPDTDTRQSNKIAPGTKAHAVFQALQRRSYNRFEAARDLGDWCLNSTVAELQARGITIARAWEKVPGRTGKAIRVCRYWIPQGARHERGAR